LQKLSGRVLDPTTREFGLFRQKRFIDLCRFLSVGALLPLLTACPSNKNEANVRPPPTLDNVRTDCAARIKKDIVANRLRFQKDGRPEMDSQIELAKFGD